MRTTQQTTASQVDVSGELVNEVMSNLGIGDIVELIDNQNTQNSHSVTEVINRIEAIMQQHRTQQRAQLVGLWAIKALWHGWRATVKWNGETHVFGKVPAGVRQDFILKCIELGTRIAVRQIEKANGLSK